MSFATYWDLEPKARAALSESEVQRYLDAELMLKGVLKVEPPSFDEVPDVAPIARATWYRVPGFDAVFASADLAQRFIDLQPRSTDTKRFGTDWRAQETVECIEASKPLDVVTVSLASETAAESHRATLEKRAAARASNEKLREEYNKALKLQNEALKGLWDDWHERRAEAVRHQKVIDTYAGYVQTAGDHDVAAKFLLKVFSAEQINDASEWTGVTIPTEFPEAPDPGPSHPNAPEAQAGDDIPL
jgi:hypothetical protein